MNKSLFIKTQRIDELTGGIVNTFRHPCGLIAHFIPKSGFSKKFAGILVPYGSIHNKFQTAQGPANVPAGTAHYLEHCIFSKEENGGLLTKLSSYGANANAYTSHTHTMYYFTTVNHFEETFELYFKSVITPYLEQDRVDAERNVILQELDMYEDDPDNQCFSQLIESLYTNHPVRIDIGGTKESVMEINPEHLKKIRECFYSPKAITITVAGDVNEYKILNIIEKYLTSCTVGEKKPSYIFSDESIAVIRNSVSYEMDVAAESFLLGMKNNNVLPQSPVIGYDKVMNQKSGQLFFEMILGSSSEIFETLYAEGLINDSFGFQYVCEETYSYLVMGGESPNPKLAARKLYKLIKEQFVKGFDAMDFELQKRVAAGNFVRSLDSVEHCGMSMAIAELSNLSIFDYQEIYDKMELDNIIDSVRFVCDEEMKTETFIIKKGTVE